MVNDYVPTNPCPTRVYVNGTRVPAEDTDIHLRKQGPLAINRYAEVNFCSPHGDKDFLSIFKSLKTITQESVDSAVPNLDRLLEQRTGPDTLRIESRNQRSDNYKTIFHGIITGVGDSNDGNNKIHHCRGRGPEFFLDQIPASNEYSNNISASEVTKYVVNELNENIALPIAGGGSTSENIQDVAGDDVTSTLKDFFDIPGPLAVGNEIIFGTLDDVFSQKTFTANRHYLSDVTKWLQDKLNARIWIQPTKKGGLFVTSSNPTQNSQSHTAHYLDGGETRIIDNNALAELRPINTIIVKGGVRRSFENPNAYGYKARGEKKEFTKTKVRHETLYQRAGQKELSDTVTKTDAVTKTEVQNEAKSILRKRLNGATGGTMEVSLVDSVIQPFDTITAKPTVNSQELQTIDPLEYEVTRSHYMAHPSKTNFIPQIELNCGIKTSNDDLVVVNSWEKDA